MEAEDESQGVIQAASESEREWQEHALYIYNRFAEACADIERIIDKFQGPRPTYTGRYKNYHNLMREVCGAQYRLDKALRFFRKLINTKLAQSESEGKADEAGN